LTNDINGTAKIDFNYANYDKVGNRLSMKPTDSTSSPQGTQVYAYDKLYQLTSVDYNDGNKTSFARLRSLRCQRSFIR
jgi:YD repeat-containing protein